jgi:hypothetical protein
LISDPIFTHEVVSLEGVIVGVGVAVFVCVGVGVFVKFGVIVGVGVGNAPRAKFNADGIFNNPNPNLLSI